MKGTENPTRKTHNPSQCRSKEYHKKKMAPASADDSDSNRHKKTYRGVISSYKVKKVLEQKLRSFLLDVILAISTFQIVSLTD